MPVISKSFFTCNSGSDRLGDMLMYNTVEKYKTGSMEETYQSGIRDTGVIRRLSSSRQTCQTIV